MGAPPCRGTAPAAPAGDGPHVGHRHPGCVGQEKIKAWCERVSPHTRHQERTTGCSSPLLSNQWPPPSFWCPFPCNAKAAALARVSLSWQRGQPQAGWPGGRMPVPRHQAAPWSSLGSLQPPTLRISHRGTWRNGTDLSLSKKKNPKTSPKRVQDKEGGIGLKLNRQNNE